MVKAPDIADSLFLSRQNARDIFNLSFLIQTQEGKVSPAAIKGLIQKLSPARNEVDERLLTTAIKPLPFLGSRYRDLVLENRIEEIDRCIEHLSNYNLLLITGLAGIGKTTIARLLAEFRHEGTPTPFWYDFEKATPEPLSDIFEKLAAYLQRPAIAQFLEEDRTIGQADLDHLIHALDQETRYWLIFNNVEKAIDRDSKFVGPRAGDLGLSQLFEALAAGRHKATILMTSREEPSLDSNGPLVSGPGTNTISGLAADHSVKLLNDNWLRQVDERLLETLAAGVDGHPLALTLLIELVKMEGSPENILDLLDSWRQCSMETLAKTKGLFDRLVGEERELLSYLSAYSEPLERSAFELMCDSGARSKAHLGTLFDKSLIRIERGLYSLHPLVRNFAYEDFNARHEAELKAAERYLSIPIPDDAASRDDVEPLLSAFEHLIKADNHEAAGDLLLDSELNHKLDLWGNATLLVDVYTKILAFKPLIDKQRLPAFLGNLASAWANLGETKKTIGLYEEALEVAREIGDRPNEGEHLANLGNAWSSLGDLEKAQSHLHEARRIFLDLRDPRAAEVAGVIENLASETD